MIIVDMKITWKFSINDLINYILILIWDDKLSLIFFFSKIDTTYRVRVTL